LAGNRGSFQIAISKTFDGLIQHIAEPRHPTFVFNALRHPVHEDSQLLLFTVTVHDGLNSYPTPRRPFIINEETPQTGGQKSFIFQAVVHNNIFIQI
jgi:hypothetical protein